MIRTLTLFTALYAFLSVLIAVAVYNNALRTELNATQDAGAVRLSEAASRLRLQLDSFRALVNFVASDPQMAKALAENSERSIADDLIDLHLTYGARYVDLVNVDNKVIASSDPERLGGTLSGAIMNAAMNSRLGTHHGIENGRRLFWFSRGVRGEGRQPLGAIVVSADMEELEFEWPFTPEPIVFFDENNLSFSANRPELLNLGMGEEDGRAPFPLFPTQPVAGNVVWNLRVEGDETQNVVRLHQDIAQLDLRAELFLSTNQVLSTARLRMFLALATAGVIGLIGAVAFQQSRRYALETLHSATLETRVDARTAELRAAQSELVETSNLAALGRLSAGVSHELNQPLGAILNFAENGQKLLQRERLDGVSDNLSMISNQVQRITRIIGNLRAFARQDVAPTEVVEFGAVARSALEIVADNITRAEIEVQTKFPAHEIKVLAGRVRLEQVVLNLVSNALDSMEQTEEKSLYLSLLQDDAQAVLTLRDTGDGIKDPERVFEPFYTTKNLGASHGLGMGLALSFGIINRLGGQLSCRNTEDGAEFKIVLPVVGD